MAHDLMDIGGLIVDTLGCFGKFIVGINKGQRPTQPNEFGKQYNRPIRLKLLPDAPIECHPETTMIIAPAGENKVSAQVQLPPLNAKATDHLHTVILPFLREIAPTELTYETHRPVITMTIAC